MFKTIAFALIATIMFTGIATEAVAGPYPDAQIQQSLNLNGLSINLYGNTTEAWLHEGEDDETGETWSHWHEQEARGDISIRLDQEFMGRNYQPIRNDVEVRRWDDEGSFNVRGSFEYLFTDTVETDWTEPASSNLNWNAFGIQYWADIHTEHERIWYGYDDMKTTDDIRSGFYVGFQDSVLEHASFEVDEFTRWFDNEEYHGLEITANFEFSYIGGEFKLPLFNQLIPMATSFEAPPETETAVPEPAGLTLFGLCLLATRKRRS
jgi:hypothetical protein